MYIEKRYDFKRELLKIHKDYRRDYTLTKNDDEYEIVDGTVILVPKDCGEVIMTAVRDFEDYMFTSMGVSVRVSKNHDKKSPTIKISLNQDLGKASGYMGYRITTTNAGITLEGYDESGVQQGLYFIEDLLNIRKSPFMKIGVIARKSRFESRSTHSPFGMFAYNDEALATMAHAGMNKIGLWLFGVNTDQRDGFIDIELLCDRAEKYGIGIDVSLTAKHIL